MTEYTIDLNATQAAIRAGYSPRTARAIGAENLTKPDIRLAIEAGQVKLVAKAELIAEEHLEQLKRARDRAWDAGDLRSFLRAEELRGRVVGLYVARTEDVTQLTREQRREKVKQLLGISDA